MSVESLANNWFSTKRLNRSQSCVYSNHCISSFPLESSAPQKSVPGPLQFITYTKGISTIFQQCSINFHLFAYDTKLCVSTRPQESAASPPDGFSWMRTKRRWLGLALKLAYTKQRTKTCHCCWQLRRSLGCRAVQETERRQDRQHLLVSTNASASNTSSRGPRYDSAACSRVNHILTGLQQPCSRRSSVQLLRRYNKCRRPLPALRSS